MKQTLFWVAIAVAAWICGYENQRWPNKPARQTAQDAAQDSQSHAGDDGCRKRCERPIG